MATDNTHKYGFRWVGSFTGESQPKPLEFLVASAYQATVSATSVDLNIGDPVQFNVGAPGTGFMELATVAQNPSILWGVIVGVSNVKVGLPLKGRKFNRVPGGTTWTTEEDATKILVCPMAGNIWEIDCDDKVTATTLTGYRALVNRCANISYNLDITDTSRPKANPMLAISDANDDEGDLRIVNVSKTALNQDYAGSYVKMLVTVNESGEAPYVTDPGV